jgi:phage gp36-like protein
MSLQYASVDDLLALCGERELIELRPSADGMSFDVVSVQQAIDAAQAVVDSYIGQVYALPMRGCERLIGADTVLTAPPLLRVVTLDIARFGLHRDLTDTHEVYRRHKQARVDLDAVAQGKRALVCPWGGPAPGQTLEGARAAQNTDSPGPALSYSGAMDGGSLDLTGYA